ncbi:MAG: prepilin peptidase [Clostridium sp.]|nr:prepilin peptidase [Clostridium sp.]
MKIIFILKIVLLIVITAVSAYTDLKENKIRNKYLLPSLILAFILSFAYDGLKGIKASIIGAIIPIVIFYVFYVMRALGAGDIKLYSVIGAIMGNKFLLYNILYTMIAGGIISIVLLIKNKNLISRLKTFFNYMISFFKTGLILEYSNNEKGARFPFGIAIFFGTLVQLVVNYI